MTYCVKKLTIFLLKLSAFAYLMLFLLYSGLENHTWNTTRGRTRTKLSRSINSTKSILVWTRFDFSPIYYLKTKQIAFYENNCQYTNCFVTGQRTYFQDITQFDAIVFNGRNLYNLNHLPSTRASHQKYVFTNLESSVNYPVCSEQFDNFFNWTWTYRLDSDVAWTYFTVHNNAGVAIAPNKTVDWITADDDSAQISDELKEKLNKKTKAAALFISNCKSVSHRKRIFTALRRHLRTYNLDVDVYGDCGKFKCPKNKDDDCNKILSEDYYFYLAFENSLVEDYVTEKVLTALNHDTVPVVFGGANYTRQVDSYITVSASF